MARKETIQIFYPGSVISVNHMYGRRRTGGLYLKPEAKAWAEELMWLLKHLHLEDWHLPLHVTCSASFRDERASCDLSNFSKLILDSIEELIGVNDKDFRWHDGVRAIEPQQDSFLLITISEPMPDLSLEALQSKSTPLEVKVSGKL